MSAMINMAITAGVTHSCPFVIATAVDVRSGLDHTARATFFTLNLHFRHGTVRHDAGLDASRNQLQ